MNELHFNPKNALIRSNNPSLYLSLLLAAYIIFLFYSALFPFHDWRLPTENIFSILLFGWLDYIFIFDIVQNLLFFIPFGLFMGGILIGQQKSLWKVVPLLFGVSFLVSLSIETIQIFNPARLPSLLDVALNALSGACGSLLAFPLMRYYDRIIAQIRSVLEIPSQQQWPYFGMAVWIVWAGYQLYPFIPTLHPNQILEGLMPITQFLKKEIPFYFDRFLLYMLQGTLLYFAGRLFLKVERVGNILMSFVAITFVGKIFIIERLLAPEAVLGCLGAVALLISGSKIREIFSFQARKNFNSEVRKVEVSSVI